MFRGGGGGSTVRTTHGHGGRAVYTVHVRLHRRRTLFVRLKCCLFCTPCVASIAATFLHVPAVAAAIAVCSIQVVEAVTGMLGRLTTANLEEVVAEVVTQEIKSLTVLEAVVVLVFEKALSDMLFQDVYAKLCSILSDKAGEWCQAFLRVRVWTPCPGLGRLCAWAFGPFWFRSRAVGEGGGGGGGGGRAAGVPAP
jgi:hypothetical protein